MTSAVAEVIQTFPRLCARFLSFSVLSMMFSVVTACLVPHRPVPGREGGRNFRFPVSGTRPAIALFGMRMHSFVVWDACGVAQEYL
ncbi:hypothetical protein Pta02_70360 [Planobispora takensis]|uniref:Uncharacterized protein n=1 Tax=Planobispora takensis TaxID=1367882 RepID=A0A8J3T6G4_9ACTN|nr:hypothetical protein Pta02_70360 [Planobispora takensis]